MQKRISNDPANFMETKKHGFTHTDAEHHADGSITLTHTHIDPAKSIKRAVSDLDEMHDSMEDCCNPDEPEKVEKELEDRGIDPEKLEEDIAPGLHALMAGVMEN
jgi:hypothetical protein